MFLKRYIESFLEMLAAQRCASPKTLESYRFDLSQFLASHPDIRSHKCLEQYHKYLSYRYQSLKTIARKVASVRGMLKFLYEEHIIPNPPILKIMNLHKQDKIPTYLSKQELCSLIEYIKKDKSPVGIRMNAIVEGIYASGMRISEITNIKKSQVEQMIKHQLNHLRIKGKNNTERIVFLNEHSIEAFSTQIQQIGECNWLFPGKNKNKNKPMSRQRINQLLKYYAEKSGLSPEKVFPHALRHSFATHMLNNKVDLRVIQQLLGHRSINTTQIYTHLAKDKISEELVKNHPLSLSKIQKDPN